MIRFAFQPEVDFQPSAANPREEVMNGMKLADEDDGCGDLELLIRVSTTPRRARGRTVPSSIGRESLPGIALPGACGKFWGGDSWLHELLLPLMMHA